MSSTTTRVRMSPEERRKQLLEIGVRLLGTRSLDDLSIELLADEAGISRGLLYHYFGNKQAFHVAVVRKAVEDVYEITAPPGSGDPLTQLQASLGAYLDYVVDNHAGYLSLVRAASGGNEELRQIHADAQRALSDRLFDKARALDESTIIDTPATRLLARAWAALVEDAVLAWVEDPAGLSREELLARHAGALVPLVS
jgi:AcrR family transcriptional regulator